MWVSREEVRSGAYQGSSSSCWGASSGGGRVGQAGKVEKCWLGMCDMV